MAGEGVVGSRIRERRIDQGLRQADVAEETGISASYLNLIEHNKRRIGGALLARLAAVLKVDAGTLAGGADAAILDGMHAAAARIGHVVEMDHAEGLAARYPGWAGLIAAQELRLDALEDEVRTLKDRISHDPALAGALHNVITAVTSIRATAGILVSDENVDADWQRRFHLNIRDDSRKLASESKALVAYLDKPDAVGETQAPRNGYDEAEAFLAEAIERTDAVATDPITHIGEMIAAQGAAQMGPMAQYILRDRLAQMVADARVLPEADFREAAVAAQGDPLVLAKQFDVPLPVLLRRLADLPADPALPQMGLLECDAAGAILTLKTLPGFGLNRRSPSCPLWPVFSALQAPMKPIVTDVVLPDPAETRFRCFAVSAPRLMPAFDAPVLLQATMLVMADPGQSTTPPVPVGTTCRICPRDGCAARREPSVIAGLAS